MFGFGQRHQESFDGVMRMAFCVDGLLAHAGVAVTQGESGVVHGTVSGIRGAAGLGDIVAQVKRVLSLDHDARGFVALGEHDEVVARLLSAAPGLRPPLFYSPYEAAVWVALSARRNWRTADVWRARLSEAAGARFDIAGGGLSALPLPDRIVELGTDGVREATGVEATRAVRVVQTAEAALDGLLNPAILRELPEAEARLRLCAIPGIGTFYADLILLRATGVTNALSQHEPRALALVGRLYGLGGAATPEQFERIAEGWSPWRTWVTVLIRAAGSRVVIASEAV